jgi:hypothetical protein
MALSATVETVRAAMRPPRAAPVSQIILPPLRARRTGACAQANVSGLEGNRRGSSETIGWVIGSLGVVVAVVGSVLTIVHFSH